MSTVSHIKIRNFSVDDNYNIIEDHTETLTRADIEPYITQLQPGDILFTDSSYASKYFIHGEWQHSIIYLGTRPKLAETFGTENTLYILLASYFTNDMEELIIDSNSDGVHIRNIMETSNLENDSYLKGLIGFRILADTSDHEKFLQYAIKNIGKKYDYDLITEDDHLLYCSELIYESLKKIGIKLKIKSTVLGRIIVSPNDAIEYMIQQSTAQKYFSLLFLIKKQAGNIVNTPLENLK